MIKRDFSINLQKPVIFCIVFMLTGCGAGFVDSGQSLGTDDSRSLAMADVDADGYDDIIVGAGAFGPAATYNYDALGNMQAIPIIATSDGF